MHLLMVFEMTEGVEEGAGQSSGVREPPSSERADVHTHRRQWMEKVDERRCTRLLRRKHTEDMKPE